MVALAVTLGFMYWLYGSTGSNSVIHVLVEWYLGSTLALAVTVGFLYWLYGISDLTLIVIFYKLL